MDYINLQQAVTEIKRLIEDSIKSGGDEAKNNLIRSQRPICLLHDVIKAEFIRNGINPQNIRPLYGEHKGEQRISGFFKCKDQDICFIPNNVNPHKEIINVEGLLNGQIDELGFSMTERILSVNVRSQLSSISKNFDTLYERTFAEALNLHLRCPQMILGEFYMIPVYEYDDKLAKKNEVGFKSNNKIQSHIEKYIHSFAALNNRKDIHKEEYKYERVCLLIVDFNRKTPKIYNNDGALISDGLLPANTNASINNMNFNSFTQSLLETYIERFGTDKFK